MLVKQIRILCLTKKLIGMFDIRQQFPRHPEYFAQLFIPLSSEDVKQIGAAGIRIIGCMHLATGELPNEPTVNRASPSMPCESSACASEL